ncbi:MAG: laminin B domain-containing protein [Sumerlaeia bacterium]
MSAVASLCLIAQCAAQAPLVSERFDTGDGGWLAVNVNGLDVCGGAVDGSPLSPNSVEDGGHPGGYFRYFEPAITGIDPLLRAPTGFSGDLSAAFGGWFRYDRRMDRTSICPRRNDVFLRAEIDGVPVTLFASNQGSPTLGWRPARVPLIGAAWRFGDCNGPNATDAQLMQALSSVLSVSIAAEYRSGDENQDIDNVMIIPDDGAPRSTFETDDEGWTIFQDAVLSWIDQPASGSCSGSTIRIEYLQCIYADDLALGDGFAFSAPALFLGDQSAAMGMTLELDLVNTGTSSLLDDPGAAFIVLSNGTETLRYNHGHEFITGRRWRHHAVPLSPGPAWTRVSDGMPATPQEFENVLSALTAVRIRGEYVNGGEVTAIDNVVFGTLSPSGFNAADGALEAAACPGEIVIVECVSGGGDPLTYNWQILLNDDDGPMPLTGGSYTDANTGLHLTYDDAAPGRIDLTVRALGSHVGPVHIETIVSNPWGSFTTGGIKVAVTRPDGDVNGDGAVNFADLNTLLDRWNAGPGLGDLDGNSNVDFADLNILLDEWGMSCAP